MMDGARGTGGPTGGDTGGKHTGRYRRTMSRHGEEERDRGQRGDTGGVLRPSDGRGKQKKLPNRENRKGKGGDTTGNPRN